MLFKLEKSLDKLEELKTDKKLNKKIFQNLFAKNS
jgi:hypothetical protein